MKKVLVLGIGNRLMMDDGIGVHVVEELSKRNSDPDVYYVAGETDVSFCLQQIGEAPTVIIVDAAYLGEESGTVLTIPLQQVLQHAPYTNSFHEFDLFMALLCEQQPKGEWGSTSPSLLFKELKIEDKSIEGMLIGIEPYEINYGMQLSDVLQNKFQNMVDKVENIIASVYPII